MASFPEGGHPSWRFFPPAVWAAFTWLFVICLTQVDGATFYALVRGVGAVEYSDAIVVGSRAMDLGMLTVVTMMVGSVPLGFGGWMWGSDPVRLGSLALMLGGLVTVVVYSSPFAFLPLGLGAILLFAVDARGLADYQGMPIGRSMALTVFFGLAVLAVVVVLGDVRWVIGGFDVSTPFSDPSWGFSFSSLQIIAILDPVLPEITLLMLFGWVAWLLLPIVSRSAKAWPSVGHPGEGSYDLGVAMTKRASFAMLGAAVLISVFVGAYPYLHAVNPNSLIVGVDPRYHYSCSIGYFVAQGCTAYDFTHAGAIWFLEGLAALSGSDLSAFELAFPLLAVFLTSSTYVFARVGSGSRPMAGVSALLASCSIQVVAGINAGFLANWLALSFTFLFFAALLHALRARTLGYLAVACVISITILFVHVWTWALSLGVTGLFLVVSIAESALRGRLRAMKTEAIMLAALIVAVLAADLARTLLPFGSGLSVSVASTLPGLSLGNALNLSQNFSLIFVKFLLGGLTNSTWYILGAVGVLGLPLMRSDFGRLLGSWVATTSFAFVFMASSNPDANPVRFLYMLPIQVFGALGLVSLVGVLLKPHEADVVGMRKRILFFVIVLGAAVGLMVGFALDNAGFVYRGIPGT